MRSLMVGLTCFGLLAVLGGCNLLLPFALMTEHRQKVPAEFSKLDGKNVLVLMWTQPETLFDYPHVRLELSTYVADRVRADVQGVTVVDPRRVEDRLQKTLVSSADPVDFGEHFDAEMVVYMELLEFQIRDPDAPDFVRAKIESSVAVYDLATDPDDPRQYELTPIALVHPDNTALLITNTNVVRVRQEAYVKFAEMVARKFHPYEQVID